MQVKRVVAIVIAPFKNHVSATSEDRPCPGDDKGKSLQ